MVIVANQKKPSPLGARIRALREAAGITQEDAAAAVSVHVQTYMRWERGGSEPSFTALQQLAAAFDVTLNDFATEPGSRSETDEE